MTIELEQIQIIKTINRKETFAMKDLSLELYTRDFTVLTGKNGCGKSLLLRVIGGLERPQAGNIIFKDSETGKRYSKNRSPIGIFLQNPRSQVLGLTIEDDLQLGNPPDSVEQALTWAGLADKRLQDPNSLSGGELGRLILAGILAKKPTFILLDEPFGNLDYPGVKMVLQALVELHQQGVGILLITHHLDQVLAHTTRVILMKEGKLVADGIPERILPFLEDHGVKRPSGKLEDMSWLH